MSSGLFRFAFVWQGSFDDEFVGVFERFRAILHQGEIDKRVQYMIEGLFADRRKNFAEYPGVIPELDLVDSSDQITHEDMSLQSKIDVEEQLSMIVMVPDFLMFC